MFLDRGLIFLWTLLLVHILRLVLMYDLDLLVTMHYLTTIGGLSRMSTFSFNLLVDQSGFLVNAVLILLPHNSIVILAKVLNNRNSILLFDFFDHLHIFFLSGLFDGLVFILLFSPACFRLLSFYRLLSYHQLLVLRGYISIFILRESNRAMP